jgi:hypothetical protein
VWDADASASLITPPALSYAANFCRQPAAPWAAGAALAVHHWHLAVAALNTQLAHRGAQILVQDWLPVAISQTGETELLCYGPIWVPVYGAVSRTLRLTACAYTDGAAASALVTVRSSTTPPAGTAADALSWPAGLAKEATATVLGTTAAWSDEVTVPVRAEGTWMMGTWITVTLACDTAGKTATLLGLTISESPLV